MVESAKANTRTRSFHDVITAHSLFETGSVRLPDLRNDNTCSAQEPGYYDSAFLEVIIISAHKLPLSSSGHMVELDGDMIF